MLSVLRFTKICNPCFTLKASVFSEARLKIDHFRKEQQFYEKKYAFNTEPIRKKIETSVKENKIHYKLNDLVAWIHLANKPADLTTAVNATKLLIKTKLLPPDQYRGVGILLMRLVYVMDQPAIGIQLLEDKDLTDLFGVGFTHLILMNKLFILKDYNNVLKLFDKQLSHFTAENSSSKLIKTSIPFDQLSIVCHALLCLNTREAFMKMKTLIQHLEIKRSKLNNICLARCFLLSIQQKENEYALKLLRKFDQIDHSLNMNLAIIALCELGFINDALKIAKDLALVNMDLDSNKFTGRFFPKTLASLKEGAELSRNPDVLKSHSDLDTIIQNKRNILAFDLLDYCNDLCY